MATKGLVAVKEAETEAAAIETESKSFELGAAI